MCIDGEVMAGDDEPRGLVLNENDAIGIVRVEPILDVWLELSQGEHIHRRHL